MEKTAPKKTLFLWFRKTSENNFDIGIEWQWLKNGAGEVFYSSFRWKNPKLNSSYIMGRSNTTEILIGGCLLVVGLLSCILSSIAAIREQLLYDLTRYLQV